MCDLLCRKFTGRRGCGHTVSYSYQRCNAAFQRPNRQPCVPPSRRMRDLPRVIDVQDNNLDGHCPSCRGETPPSSEGSEFAIMV